MAAAAEEWTAEDEERYAALLRAQYEVEGLTSWIDRVNPRYPVKPHLAPLIELLERTRHEQVFAVVSMPPRHRKTTTILNGLAWRLAVDPGVSHAYVTYNDTKTKRESKLCRRIAATGGAQLDDTRRAVNLWGTTAGGLLRWTSIGAGFTGEGINGVVVIDDPIKDRKEAESAGRLEDTWEWFTDVAMTRLEPGSSVIIVMTRWTDNDLAGRILKGEHNALLREQGQPELHFEEINLPAICESPETDILGRARGQVLWPEQYGLPYFALRRALNPWSFEAIYQQNPKPKEGRLFQTPHTFDLDKLLARGFDGMRLGIGVDPAASGKTRADHWAAVVLAVTGWGAGMRGFVVDVLRWRSDPIAGADRLLAFQQGWGDLELVIEGGVVGKAPIESLRRQQPLLRIVEVPSTVDKYTRAQPVAAAWNDGRLQQAQRAPWAAALNNEARNFTGIAGREDDQIDALSLIWNAMVDVPEPPPWEIVGNHLPVP